MAGKRQRRVRRTVSASTMASGLDFLEISHRPPKEKQKCLNSPSNPIPLPASDLPPAMATAKLQKRTQGEKTGEGEGPPPSPPPPPPQKGSAFFVNEFSCWDAYEELVTIALPAMTFLEACCFCKRRLGHGLDIYMYRGDQAFCSEECRHEQILLDESKDKCSLLALRMNISASTVRSVDQQTSGTAAA